MDFIKVYICILNYNTFEKSRVCIESCLIQSDSSFRVVLVDNASTDDSFIKLQELFGDKIDYFQTGANYGYAKGNNLAVQYCIKKGGVYTLLLNSDTELVGKNLLTYLYDIMEEYHDCAIISPTIYEVSTNGLKKIVCSSVYLRLLQRIGVLPQSKIYNESIETISEAHGCALFIDNQKFIGVKGFPEHYFMYAEEGLLAKKLQWSGYEILSIRNSENYVKHNHDTSKSIEPWRCYLMGRNATLEFLENKKDKPKLWGFIFFLYSLQILLLCIKRGSFAHFKGIKDGFYIHSQGYTKEDIFLHGRVAKDRIR